MIIPKILKGKDMPRHIAVTAQRVRAWSIKNKKDIKDVAKQSIAKIKELIDLQIRKDIPILSIMVSTQTEEEIQALNSLFKELASNEQIHKKKVRIYAIGDWYDAEATMVDQIKEMLAKTKDYDNYFLNFCIRYDGQKEITTTSKLLVKKAEANQIEIDEITPQQMKENMASSNFLPPEIIIENNWRYSGMLQWDSAGSCIFFTNKYWMDFEKSDFDKAIDHYNKYKDKEE